MDQSEPPAVNGKPQACRVQVRGHFGELVQGRLGRDGPVALVTLPCSPAVTEVHFAPARGPLEIKGEPSQKSRRAANLALDRYAPKGWGGQLGLVPWGDPGAGTGSSTASVLGTIRAIARAFGAVPSPEDEAAFCLEAEGAVDPLMYPGNLCFASRAARVIEHLPPLPAFRVVGGIAGPGKPTEPDDQNFPDMRKTFALLKTGLAEGDLLKVARASRQSAEANQDRNPNPIWDDILRIGQAQGALGPVVSHTGSAIGLMVPPDRDGQALARHLQEAGLARTIVFDL